ncbi:MAG: hypothetical protein IGS39_01245 [Calothrix sp. C42_A2020_038]|nr:hypothetical protein [Calothrix sp. C42_A2020_038]
MNEHDITANFKLVKYSVPHSSQNCCNLFNCGATFRGIMMGGATYSKFT